MPNHNVQIMSPKGEKTLVFPENVSMDECRKYIHDMRKEMGVDWPPKGYHCNIVNFNKKPRRHPEFILLTGYKPVTNGATEMEMVDERRARILTNKGWYTPRMAKRDMRAQGASFFTRKKIWEAE